MLQLYYLNELFHVLDNQSKNSNTSSGNIKDHFVERKMFIQ